VAPVHASGLLIDARDYFREFHRAALAARRHILIAGWQFDSNVALLRGEDRPPSTEEALFLPFLVSLCRRNPDLRIYLLCWDYSPAYFFQREWLQDLKFNWGRPGIQFRFDDRHAVGASHHQKFAVVDGSLGFVGSIDFCNHRWDRRDHDLHCDERCHPAGVDISGPYHEVQAYFTGPAATELVELFEARWMLSGGAPLQLAPPAPVDVRIRPSARIGGGEVGLSRTTARTLEPPHPPIREIRRLYVDAILSADRSIFIENQYFGSRAVFDALCHRFARTDRPPLDVAMVYPRELHSVTEQLSVGTQQAAMFRHLLKAAAEGGHRLGIYSSFSTGPGAEPRGRYIHSKVMIVDDRFLTVGSANTNNRSMGLDSELHVSWEAPDPLPAIRRARINLLIEHAGMNPRMGLKVLGEPTGWVATLDRWASDERGALRHHPITSRLDDNILVQTLSVEGPIMDPERAVLEEEIFEELAPSRRERVAAGIRRLRRVFGRKGRTEWIVAVNPPAALARGPSGPWALLSQVARRWMVPLILLCLLFLGAWALLALLDLLD
jgi:phosphatidylserine/phosphatidylglycerophosphate/cardiolipin synthase-like enzyme